MRSWPCLLSSAASALSRKQLPQYILAAPAVNARIFIRSGSPNCSKTRHIGPNLSILDRMAGNGREPLQRRDLARRSRNQTGKAFAIFVRWVFRGTYRGRKERHETVYREVCRPDRGCAVRV